MESKLMDAYYQVYKNSIATEFVLQNFFSNSNSGSVYLISDNGNDFHYLEEKYPNRIIYRKSDVNVRTIEWNKFQCLEWMRRVYDSCCELKSDYIMILEDDVYIRGNIDSLEIHGEIMGVPNIVKCDISRDFEEFINTHGKMVSSYKFYCACGGSIFNRKIYLDNYEFVRRIFETHFEEMVVKSKSCIRFSDCCLSVCFNLSGYQCNANPEHTETWQQDWESNNKKIVHQYKFLYGSQ